MQQSFSKRATRPRSLERVRSVISPRLRGRSGSAKRCGPAAGHTSGEGSPRNLAHLVGVALLAVRWLALVADLSELRDQPRMYLAHLFFVAQHDLYA